MKPSWVAKNRRLEAAKNRWVSPLLPPNMKGEEGGEYWISAKGPYLTMPKVFMKLRMVSISELTQAFNLSGPM